MLAIRVRMTAAPRGVLATVRLSCFNVGNVSFVTVCDSEELRSAQDDAVRVYQQFVASQQRRRLSAGSPEVHLHISQAPAAPL